MYLLISDFSALENQNLKEILQIKNYDINKMVYISSDFMQYDKNDRYSEKIKTIIERLFQKKIKLTVVDARIDTSKMISEINNCDLIFLSGGDTKLQFSYLNQYNISSSIISSKNIIGMSAGAINLTKHVFLPEKYDKYTESSISYNGLSILDFVIIPHFEDVKENQYNSILQECKNELICFIKNSGFIYMDVENEDLYVHGCSWRNYL